MNRPIDDPSDSAPALIFDFGNVVAHFDYNRACEALGRDRGLDGPTLLAKARDAGLVPLVKRYEIGAIDDRTFSKSCLELIGLEVEHDEFAAAWADIFWLNEPVARLIERLRARGHRLVLGSNTNAIHATHFRRQFAETFAHFDRLVLSYEVGHLKPDRGFYLACAEAAGRPPSECVFIDDLAENVDAARLAGLVAIRYEAARHHELEAALADLGIAF